MNFQKYNQDVDQNHYIIEIKNNDCKSFFDSLCNWLQNANAVVRHLLFPPDNEIEVNSALNVGHQEKEVT